MISICPVCGKTYNDSEQHSCAESNFLKASGGYVTFAPKPTPHEIEVRIRIVNNLKKLRTLSESCNHMIPAVCGIVAEIQADINILWGDK